MSFVLKVDPVKVDKEYKMLEHSRTRLLSHNPMATKLEDLGFTEIQHHTEYPLFETKETNTLVFGHLNDYIKNRSLPTRTDICCMYCSEQFTTPPLGIPTNYIPSYYVARFNQENKEEQTIVCKHDIHSKVELKRLQEKGVEIVIRDYFEVDGNFCSFPCMIAYYKMYRDRLEYKDSQGLIKRLHQKLYGTPIVWRCAPDIRLLKKFGGHMSIEEFRSSEASLYSASITLNRVKFSSTETPPVMAPVSRLYSYLKPQ